MKMTAKAKGLAALYAASLWAGASLAQQQPTIENLRSARDALVGVEDFTAALDPAERVVTALEEQGVTEISNDILRLARVQAGLQDFESAELNYLKAIALIKDQEGEFSRTLIGAHQALGRTYINTRRLPEAIGVLGDRAEH